MITTSSSDSYVTPITRLIDEHKRCLQRIAELEAALTNLIQIVTQGGSTRAEENAAVEKARNLVSNG